jgi:hypothetical protein
MTSGKRRLRFIAYGLIGLVSVVAILCGGLCVRAYFFMPGSVTSPSEFPRELKELLEITDQQHIEVKPVRVFCVSRGLYQESFWQTRASQQLIHLSTVRWDLSLLDGDSSEVQKFWQHWDRLPPSWRLPPPSETEFFVSAGWNYTEYGVMVMHDKERELLYFWYMNDL